MTLRSLTLEIAPGGGDSPHALFIETPRPSDMPMISGGQGTERGGGQARPLPRPNAAPCGRWCEPRPLPDMAEGLLGLYPDVALAPEEVVPQQLLGGEERLGFRQPRSSARVGWGQGPVSQESDKRGG